MVVQVGAQTIDIEGDTLTARVRGAFTPEDAKAYFRLAEQVHAEHGRYIVLFDLSHANTIPAETRRLAAEFGRKLPAIGVAVWGSNVAVRVLLMLLMRAVNLVQRNAVPVLFASSEAEARAWAAALRTGRPAVK